jgi:hypothetical protein
MTAPTNYRPSEDVNNFKWKADSIHVDQKGTGSEGIRDFVWQGKKYTITIHNPQRMLTLEEVERESAQRIDAMIILIERYVHGKTNAVKYYPDSNRILKAKVDDYGNEKIKNVASKPFDFEEKLRKIDGVHPAANSPEARKLAERKKHIEEAYNLYRNLPAQNRPQINPPNLPVNPPVNPPNPPVQKSQAKIPNPPVLPPVKQPAANNAAGVNPPVQEELELTQQNPVANKDMNIEVGKKKKKRDEDDDQVKPTLGFWGGLFSGLSTLCGWIAKPFKALYQYIASFFRGQPAAQQP